MAKNLRKQRDRLHRRTKAHEATKKLATHPQGHRAPGSQNRRKSYPTGKR